MSERYIHSKTNEHHPLVPSRLDECFAVGAEMFSENPEQNLEFINKTWVDEIVNNKKISQEDFIQKYPDNLIKWDSNLSHDEAEYLHDRAKEHLFYNDVQERGHKDLTQAALNFGSGLLGMALSPGNIALSFVRVPLLGGKNVSPLSRGLSLGAKQLITKTAVGAANQAAFWGATEPLKFAIRSKEHRPVTWEQATESLGLAVAFGGAIGALGHGISKLKNEFFKTNNSLSGKYATNNHVIDSEFSKIIKKEVAETSNIAPFVATNNTIEEITAKKLALWESVQKTDPKIREFMQKEHAATALEVKILEEYHTDDLGNIPSETAGYIQQAKINLEAERVRLREENPVYNKYLEEIEENNNQLKSCVDDWQRNNNAFNLSEEEYALAVKKLNEPEPFKPLQIEPIAEAKELGGIIEQSYPKYKEAYNALTMQEKNWNKVLDLIKTETDIELALLNPTLTPEQKASLISMKKAFTDKELTSLESRRNINEIKQSLVSNNSIENRASAINLVKLGECENYIRKHVDKTLGFKELYSKVDTRKASIDMTTKNKLLYMLEKEHLVSAFKSRNYERDIARELSGVDSGNFRAKRIAAIVAEIQAELVSKVNSAGGNIKTLQGYITRQTHSPTAIRKAGFNEWARVLSETLDYSKTFIDGFERERLRETYNALVTGVHLDEFNNVRHTSGMKAAEAERKLHFKDADSWLAYNKQFGEYQLKDSILLNMQSLSHVAGTMEILGTEPRQVFSELKNSFIKELQEPAARGGSEEIRQLTKLSGNALDKEFLHLIGGNMTGNLTAAKICQSARSLQSLKSLGKVLFSSIPDLVIWSNVLAKQGAPVLSSYAKALKSILYSFSSEQKKEFARKLGVSVDSMLGSFYSKIHAESHIPGVISKMNDIYFKLNGLAWWDNSFKSSMGLHLSQNLAERVHLPFDELEPSLQNTLSKYGFNKENWKVYESLRENVEGIDYLNPEKAGGLVLNKDPIKNTNAQKEIEYNLRHYLLDMTDTGIATPHAHERYMASFGGLPSGTVGGELARFIMQFKTFPLSFTTRSLKYLMLDSNTPATKRMGGFKNTIRAMMNPKTLGILGSTVIGTTVLGYISMCAKDISANKELKDPEDPATWHEAMLRGGGVGIIGDVLFKEYSSAWQAAGDLTGVVPGEALRIFTDLKNSSDPEKLGNTFIKTIKRNVPGKNLFYVDYILSHLFDE